MYTVKSVAQDNVVPKEIMYKLRGPNFDDGQSTSAGGPVVKENLDAALKKSLLLIDDLAKSIKALTLEERSKISGIAKSTKKPAAASKANANKAPKKVVVGPYFQKAVKKELNYTLENSLSRANAQYDFIVISLPAHDDKVVIRVGELFKPLVNEILATKPLPAGLKIESASGSELSIAGRNFGPAQVLEILGALLGLHDPDNVQFYGANRWLDEAVSVIKGEKSVDSLVRSGNVHLGPNDLFTGVNQVTLADIVVYQVIRDVNAVPSNSELFVERVKNALSTA
uniref:GST C-terminal domain-containing protein n=1 Tax=Panagrellus redivivus TaxID=6233 RepID=A0A7E4ZZT7_PANRE